MDKNIEAHDLKAIIIADPFKSSLGPYQAQHPTCLLPVVNEPVIGYTIEFLIYNKISEVIIWAFEHYKEISSFIDSQKYSDIKIRCIKFNEKQSAASAIKDLDNKDLIKNDFILLNGFMVTNIDISNAIRTYNKRKQNEEPMLMTKLFIRLPFNSSLRSEEISVVVDNENNEIFKYENMQNKKQWKINEYFEYKQKNHRSLSVRMDLIDWDIDIINHNSIIGVLGDSENYDQFKDEFINHINESEIINDKIFLHEVVGNAYFSRISTPENYYQTCLDVIESLPYPLVPGGNLDSRSLIEYKNLKITGNEEIDFKGINESIGSIWIGAKSQICTGTQIEDSLIGYNVILESNCEIRQSILHNKVVVGQGSTLKGCIVTEGVSLDQNSEYENKIIVTQDGQTKTFPITLIKDSSNEDSEESDLMSEETDEEKEDSKTLPFEEEITQIVNRQIEEGHSVDNLRTEVNSVRFSQNKALIECLVAIVPALIDNVLVKKASIGKDEITELKNAFSTYSEYLKTFIITKNDQAHLIECIEKCCINNEHYQSAFHLFLQILWQEQLLSSEAILEWSESKINSENELRGKFLAHSQQFLKYLKDKLEEGSDEDEEEESEEDD